jgi:peptidyl-prolyl cis-trans isomerase B (cyclophilin B)
VVSRRERRKALARAKWERQQARRTAAQRRARRLSIIGGTAAAVVAAGLIGWGGYALVTGDDSPGTGVPTDSNFPTLKTPTVPDITVTSFSAGTPTTGSTTSTTGSTTPATTPTTPTTTGTSAP